MAKVIVNIPDDIPMSSRTSEAVMQTTRVVHGMAKWFGADVHVDVTLEKNPEKEGDRRVVSFRFEGGKAGDAAENVEFFVSNNFDMKNAHIAASHVEKGAGSAAIKMDLDKLSELQHKSFDSAAYDAAHNGSIVASHLARQAQGGREV